MSCQCSGVDSPVLHRQLGLVGSTRPSTAPMVVVDEAQARRQRLEASVEGVVNAETTVHHERRRSGADLLVEQLDAVDVGDRHKSPLTLSADTMRFATRPRILRLTRNIEIGLNAADRYAAFMNALADDGVPLFAGPLAGSEHGRIRALLIVKADSEAVVLDRLAADAWAQSRRLVTTSVEPWNLLSAPTGSPSLRPPSGRRLLRSRRDERRPDHASMG